MTKLRVMIGIPSRGSMESQFTACLAALCGHLSGNGISFHLNYQMGSGIWKNREQICADAIDADCTHLLFVDDDMIFPVDVIERLAAHDKDVVACNVVIKKPDCPYFNSRNALGAQIITGKESSGLEECSRTGTAVMLIKTEVLKAIAPPRFEIKWDESLKSYTGEDYYFCDLVARYGFKAYIDHDMSKRVGHIGPFIYRPWHVDPSKFDEHKIP